MKDALLSVRNVPLMQAIREQVIIGDGAMGTFLYQLGFGLGVCFEQFNVTKPEVIRSVHTQYVDAGARLLATNTFAANRLQLQPYGLAHEVHACNTAAVRLAREAGGDKAYVCGALGPLRGKMRGLIEEEESRGAIAEQVEALLVAGVDGILLETFADMEEAVLTIGEVRKQTTAPILCHLAIETGTTVLDSTNLVAMFQRLYAEGADVVGLNCRSGPYAMTRLLAHMSPSLSFPLSVYPNAGLPAWEDGAYSYPASPAYFAQSGLQLVALGARIVGGCCGTTPAHIQALSETLRAHPQTQTPTARAHAHPPESIVLSPSPLPHQPPTLVDLVRQRHTVIVELDPPREASVNTYMKAAKQLQDAGIDAITLADNSLAMTRVSNMAVGQLIAQQLGVRPLLHVACRDRNAIALQSHLMGMHVLGMDHVLVITGDPPKFGDLPGATSVYDVTSMQLIRNIKQMNAGVHFSGKPMKEATQFVVGAALNPNVKYISKAIERLEKKIEAGCDFVMTQPIYDPAVLHALYAQTKHLSVPIFVGIMPFTSGRNAEYLHNEVPGISLSVDVLQRMRGLEGQAGREMSLTIAREMVDAAMPLFKGIYLITPFFAVEMTATLTKHIAQQRKDTP